MRTRFSFRRRGNRRHAARIKLAIDPPDNLDPNGVQASVAVHDGNAIGDISARLLADAQRFIDLNRQTLIDYWEYRIDGDELRQRLRSI
jgi:hypothetical protein